MEINIGISNRHVHLKQEDVDILFGKDYVLTKKRDLSQLGQYACEEMVTLKTEKNEISRVRVLGPVRKYSQVEMSKTDAFTLGLNPPVRESGDLSASESITLIGPKGEVHLEEGCIIASRHIHAHPDDVKRLGLEGVSEVDVLLPGVKGGILHHVSIKVDPTYVLELHLDTDDGNAHLIDKNTKGIILKREDHE